MNRALLLLLAAALPLCPIACSTSSEETTSKKSPSPSSKLVGRIASISADRKFVLIQHYGSWEVPAGATLIAQGPGRVANLRYSGEKLGQHVAADLQSGETGKGDAVLYSAPDKEPKTDADGFTPNAIPNTKESSTPPQSP